MSSIFADILSQTIMIIGGILLAGVSTLGGFYMKRLSDRIKRKELVNEINRYVDWIGQAESFKELDKEEKLHTVLEAIRAFALDNGITISETELIIMIEMSDVSLRRLNALGLKLTEAKKLTRKEE